MVSIELETLVLAWDVVFRATRGSQECMKRNAFDRCASTYFLNLYIYIHIYIYNIGQSHKNAQCPELSKGPLMYQPVGGHPPTTQATWRTSAAFTMPPLGKLVSEAIKVGDPESWHRPRDKLESWRVSEMFFDVFWCTPSTMIYYDYIMEKGTGFIGKYPTPGNLLLCSKLIQQKTVRKVESNIHRFCLGCALMRQS